MLPVIYWGISNIEMSKRIFIYIFTNHVCLLSTVLKSWKFVINIMYLNQKL